jgi:uncharacterized membrane protein
MLPLVLFPLSSGINTWDTSTGMPFNKFGFMTPLLSMASNSTPLLFLKILAKAALLAKLKERPSHPQCLTKITSHLK